MVELMVGTMAFFAVFSAIVMMIQVSTHNQARVAGRVYANQRARPVMTNIIDALHSACVAPGVAPIAEGSTSTSMTFISKPGETVAPTPDRRVLTFTGNTLTQQIYPATGGAAPNWTFSGTPSSNRTLIVGVGQGNVGDPPTLVPYFRYYDYTGGQVSAAPLAVPLTATTAPRVVMVNVTFAASPSGIPTSDTKAPITLSDSAILRLEPASEDSSEVNLPCV
jgi:hypothetical protein